VSIIGRHDLHGDTVMPENEIGGYLLGTEVFTLGHRKIGVIAGPKVLTTITDRLTGLRRAAREHGRSLPTKRIVYADFNRDGGAAAAAELLDASPDLTAIVALNDSMAIGALTMLRERGISVPADLSVVGFDDMPIARDVTPALTTVRLPLADMGARAMTLALEATGGEPRVERATAEIVRRASAGPPP
jgi:LacI family transcriptional regulator